MLVRPKQGILDPQGQAVENSLRQLGFAVTETRVGRVVDVEVEAADREAELAQRRLDGLSLWVEDPVLRSNQNGGLHRKTAPGSARYSSKPIPVSRSNAST